MSDRTRYTADLVSNSNLYVNTTTDRTGIGTTVPRAKLHVIGDAIITGIVSTSSGPLISGVGIATESGTIGVGVTLIDFRGPGVSTVTVSSGIATINITGNLNQSYQNIDGGNSRSNYGGIEPIIAGGALQ